jgi:hypothetical protein
VDHDRFCRGIQQRLKIQFVGGHGHRRPFTWGVSAGDPCRGPTNWLIAPTLCQRSFVRNAPDRHRRAGRSIRMAEQRWLDSDAEASRQ